MLRKRPVCQLSPGCQDLCLQRVSLKNIGEDLMPASTTALFVNSLSTVEPSCHACLNVPYFCNSCPRHSYSLHLTITMYIKMNRPICQKKNKIKKKINTIRVSASLFNCQHPHLSSQSLNAGTIPVGLWHSKTLEHHGQDP